MANLKKQGLLYKMFGIGIKTAKKIYCHIGLNKRKTPTFLGEKHTFKIDKLLNKQLITQELKKALSDDINTLKKIKTYKSTVSFYNKKNNSYDKIQKKGISTKKKI